MQPETVNACKDRGQLLQNLPKGQMVMEIGVWKGQFAEAILHVCRPTQLHLVDLWLKAEGVSHPGGFQPRPAHNKAIDKMAAGILDGRVIMHQGFTADVMKLLPTHRFDWIYVDASHHYDACLKDLFAAERLIKPGGLLMGHDYVHQEGDASRKAFGVIEAVESFLSVQLTTWKWVGKTQEHYASFVLEKTA